MQFKVGARYFVREPGKFSLREVWELSAEELSRLGQDCLELLSEGPPELRRKAAHVVWCSQAVIEFQDLQGLPLPGEGQFFNVQYLFLEGLRGLREAVVAGLNGQIHASFAVLRSAMEMFGFHHWWKNRLFGADSYEDFHHWLFGEKGAPPFRNILEGVYSECSLPDGARGLCAFQSIYQRLNSYAHKPLLEESVTFLRGGNIDEPPVALVGYWLGQLEESLRCTLDLSIAVAPQAVYPIPLERKFGFYPPLGMFFDHSNFLPLQKALGQDRVRQYQQYYSSLDPPRTLVEWATAHRDLSEVEILDSWKEEDLEDSDEPARGRIVRRCCIMRAKTRVLMHRLTYSTERPEIDDLRDKSIDLEALRAAFKNPAAWASFLADDPGLVTQLSDQLSEHDFEPGSMGALLQEAIKLLPNQRAASTRPGSTESQEDEDA